ncbi:MAG: zinc ribbon domain-containing protein [Deferribacteres bacterium]|nr:zinc ribbon domain-containing protein [Deferribacteres bacterium]
MPIYEYICLKCDNKFALLQSLYPADNSAECPKCSSKDVKKEISAFSFGAGSGNSVSPVPATGFSGGG